MTVAQMIQNFSLVVFHLEDEEACVTGGYTGDLLSWVMGSAQAGDAWLTIMSNQNVAAVAVLADVACVVLTEGVQPDENLLKKCQAQGVNLLGTADNSFTLAGKLSAHF